MSQVPDQYSQTPTFYIENMSGAAFRALLNQILAALSEQNSGSTPPSDPFPGMFWLDTSVKPAQLRLRNDNNDGWDNVFTHGHPPTKGQIGLSNVDNYGSTASLTDGSPNKFFLASGAKLLQDNKLGKDATAKNSLALGGYSAGDYAFKVGTYPQLRAQGTTKADVGLSLVKNYNISDSLNANNSSQYASSKAVYTLNQNKVAVTVTINGKALSSNITLTATDVQALPAKGGNLTGPISYTLNSGDVIRFGTKAVLRKISSNGGVALGCDDALILGSGEACKTLEDNVSVTTEQVHAGADDAFYIYSNLQAGWSSRRRFDFEKDGGFKPANVSKTRQNLSVYAKSETYSRNETYSRSQTYSRAEVEDRLPIVRHQIIDYGTVGTDKRYVKPNPFGNNSPVIVQAEIYFNGVWANSGYGDDSDGKGTMASYVQGVGVVVQTGRRGVVDVSRWTGGGHGATTRSTSAPCRVHVWYLGS